MVRKTTGVRCCVSSTYFYLRSCLTFQGNEEYFARAMNIRIPTVTFLLIIGGSLILYGIFKVLIENEFMIPDRFDLLLPAICVWAGICLILGIWTYKREGKDDAE